MKPSWNNMVVIFCMSALALAGCREQGKTVHETKQSGEVSKQIAEEAPDHAVAMVGDEAITEADLDVSLDNIPERRRESLRTRTIYYLVDTYIYASEAKKMGFDEDPELQKEIEKTRREILARAFMTKHIEPNIEPTEEEVRAYYDENKETQFIIPEGVMVQQIRTVKREDAESALEALKRGEPFGQVAEAWSKLVRKKNRKNSEWLYRKRIDPVLEEAVFAVEVGQFSGVIPLSSDNEYRVVKVLGKSEEKPVEYKDAKSPIRFRLMQRKKTKMMHDCYERAGVKRSPEKGILVQVGDEVFKEEAISHILAHAKDDHEKEKLKARWTQYYIDTEVFSKEALNLGLEKDPDVARKIKWRTLDVLADAYREKVIEKKIEVTDADIAAEYKANPGMFTQPLRFKVGLMVVEKREKAEDLRKQIDKGTPFSVLAQKESIDASAKNGGAIDWFKEGEQEAVIEEAAKKLERFEVSEVLKMKNGYGLVKLMGRQGGVQPLEGAAKGIRDILHKKRLKKEREYYHDKWNARILEAPESQAKPPMPAEGSGSLDDRLGESKEAEAN